MQSNRFQPLRCTVVALAALLASLGATLSAAGRAGASPLSPLSLSQQTSALANATIGEWTDHELSDGWLADPVLGPLAGDYGVSMTGQAMVEAGSASTDEALIEDGLRAEQAEAERPDDGGFELLALSEAYSWNQVHMAEDPAWLTVRPTIAAFLSEHGQPISDTGSCDATTDCYDNLKLVTAVADLALLRTNLSGSAAGALLSNRAKLRAQALALLAAAARNTGRDARRLGSSEFSDAGILSDPTENPLAYHALSTLMLGRVALALGTHTPRPVMAALSRAANALLGLMAPDGNVAYIGRGQGQVWTVGATIDALTIAADLTADAAWRGRYLAGAALALQHLETAYPRDGWGFPLVPRLVESEGQENYLGVDGYANTVEYDGLTLWALQNATSILSRIAPAPAEPPPSQTAGVFIDPSHTRFAAVTHGDLWYAVHGTDSNLGDARYGFGLVAAELHTADGWLPALPYRPLTSTPQAGGLRMRVDGESFYPLGTSIDATPGGVVSIHGGWQTSSGRRQDGVGSVWTYRPTAAGNGVTLSFRVRARCAYQFQVWYVSGARVSASEKRLRISELGGISQIYSFNVPISTRAAGMFHSAYADELDSKIITAAPGQARVLRYTTTVEG